MSTKKTNSICRRGYWALYEGAGFDAVGAPGGGTSTPPNPKTLVGSKDERLYKPPVFLFCIVVFWDNYSLITVPEHYKLISPQDSLVCYFHKIYEFRELLLKLLSHAIYEVLS